MSSTATSDISGWVRFYQPSASDRPCSLRYFGVYQCAGDLGEDVCSTQGAGRWKTNTAVNGLQLSFNSGLFNAGTIRLYGIK